MAINCYIQSQFKADMYKIQNYLPNAFENIMHPSLHQISTTNASKLC